MTAIDRWAERAVHHALGSLRHGSLRLETEAGVRVFGSGGPVALLQVHDRRFYRRALSGGDVGLGESYMAGEWSTPDLVGLVRLMLANRDVLDALPAGLAWITQVRDAWRHRSRRNSRDGSRANIHTHYDLGNPFFRLFLDPNLLYSCAVYERADDTLEQAQINKLRGICDALQLGPGDRVLEIGTGWGGFALYAATRYGCHVTTTTISREQHDHAAARFASAGGASERIELRFDDYRDLTGRFDKIVSIEMFEAVGLDYYDEFFSTCERLLGPNGLMLLQTITVDDWRFDEYRRTPSWIAKYIFPGAELASTAEILQSVARVSRLGLHHTRQIGIHYAHTLHAWRARFLNRLDEVRRQGFDDRFIRMWDLYLGYCEAAFAERHIGDVQLLFARASTAGPRFDEPHLSRPSALDPATSRPSPMERGVSCE